jgi:hypothetical protein
MPRRVPSGARLPTPPAPAAHHLDGVGALPGLAPAAVGAHRVRRTGWHEAGGEIRQGRENEEAIAHGRMRDLEESRRGGRIHCGRPRGALGWSLDGQPMAAEEQEVEVELARTPALPRLAAELAFDALERDKQVDRARRRVRAGGDVECDDRIVEIGLVRHSHRRRAVQAGDAAEAGAGHVGEGRDGLGQGPAGVTNVRPEPDVRPNPPSHRHLDRPLRAPRYSRRVERVAVRILHPASSPSAGDLERVLVAARAANADRLGGLFRSVGADNVRIDTGPPDGRSFGDRLRGLVDELAVGAGLVVLGSGAVPLLGRRGAAELVAIARSGERRALANNRYSADVVAIGGAAALASVPDLPNDNPLPRWLAEQAGYVVEDLRRRWRLGIDLDSPLDVLLTGGELEGARVGAAGAVDVAPVLDRMDGVRAVAADPRAELLVAGRTSAATLRWLERSTASRTRALVEERGLRAIGLAGAAGPGSTASDGSTADGGAMRVRGQRPPRSALGTILDDRGPEALGLVLAALGDAAIIDTRVLLAHRLGADEAAWPVPEDRFASDLLIAERIRDPWLRALTVSARDAAIPVLLGGHTLVGPGIRLVLGRSRARRSGAGRK